MNATATPSRSSRTARHASERTPNPVVGIVFCLAVFAGGLFGAQQWLTDVCPTTPDLAAVCAVALD